MVAQISGVVVVALLLSCGTSGSRGEDEHQTRTGESEPPASAETLATPCDTLRTDIWHFVPLHCQLSRPLFNQRDSQQVRSALVGLDLPFDSLWVRLPFRGIEGILIDSVSLRIDLYLYDGIAEDIELERSGISRQGNSSGRDGTLTIDRQTGAHTYGLWQ